MERSVYAGGKEIRYTLERKKVKNINLRVRGDGMVAVSASQRVPVEEVDRIVLENGEKILAAIERFEKRTKDSIREKEYSREETEAVFRSVLARVYPPFGERGVPFPILKIRHMKSRWGSCIPSKRTVTLNSRLMNYSVRCIEYVVVHELCHFFEPNHSVRFYARMTEMLPDWKERKTELGHGPISDDE